MGYRTKQLIFKDLKLDQSKLCVCWVYLSFYCSLRLPLAVYLFHFFILRVCLCWFGLLLLFVLFLYWYIMEEFELPWAIVSIITSCSILFCFWELLCGFVRICVCVCGGVLGWVILLSCVLHDQLKPTLKQTKKRYEMSLAVFFCLIVFMFVWVCDLISSICLPNFDRSRTHVI